MILKMLLVSPIGKFKEGLEHVADANSQNTGATVRGVSQKSASLWVSGSVWVAGLLFRKLSIFWVIRAFDDLFFLN